MKLLHDNLRSLRVLIQDPRILGQAIQELRNLD